MNTRFSGLLPDRLYPRLVLLIIFSMLAIFILTLTIFVNDRTQAFFLAQQTPLIGRIERLLVQFESAPERQRPALVNRFSALNFRIEMGANVASAPIGQKLALSRGELNGFTESFENIGRSYAWNIVKYQPDGNSTLTPRLYASTALRDGTAVSFNYILPQTPISPSNAYLALAVVLISVVIFASILARQLLKPLAQLEKHARALGRSLEIPPLATQGPEEIQAAGAAMNTLQRRLKDMESERKEMLTAVSHDLKTPITRMLLRTEFMDDEVLVGKFTHDLLEMEGMINDALTFIRTHTDAEQLEPTDIYELLNASVQESIEMGNDVSRVGNPAGEEKVQVILPLRKKMIKRCIDNLISNGVKYGQSVECDLIEEDDRVVLTFTDQGPGLPDDQLDKVFEPFYRIETSRNKASGGHGLGLAICLQIARSHGGNVTLENRAGLGLVAKLALNN
ncbi:MAG: ATP-binding protein [Gammaproteobacteria bacterium]|nr:ATP-binding protein [Gammaproteobacteria bacterium]